MSGSTRAVVEAIEAFIDAKIDHARRYATDDPMWISTIDVDETREHLINKLINKLREVARG